MSFYLEIKASLLKDVVKAIENINAEKHTLGISCRNVTLQSGDVLYLPRGVLHAPHTNRCNNGNIPNDIQPTVTSSVEKSLHISIGIDVYSSRWASLFQNFILNHSVLTGTNVHKLFTL